MSSPERSRRAGIATAQQVVVGSERISGPPPGCRRRGFSGARLLLRPQPRELGIQSRRTRLRRLGCLGQRPQGDDVAVQLDHQAVALRFQCRRTGVHSGQALGDGGQLPPGAGELVLQRSRPLLGDLAGPVLLGEAALDAGDADPGVLPGLGDRRVGPALRSLACLLHLAPCRGRLLHRCRCGHALLLGGTLGGLCPLHRRLTDRATRTGGSTSGQIEGPGSRPRVESRTRMRVTAGGAAGSRRRPLIEGGGSCAGHRRRDRHRPAERTQGCRVRRTTRVVAGARASPPAGRLVLCALLHTAGSARHRY
jgi:hypothetical protein